MAKPNYAFAKRQRDLAKKAKKEEKRLRKIAEGGDPDAAPAEGTDPEATAQDTEDAEDATDVETAEKPAPPSPDGDK